MMSINWRELFQDNNIIVSGTCDKSYDINGNAFVTFTSGGEKKQGEIVPALYSTKTKAVKAFEDGLLVWLNGRRKVYLRMFPEVREVKYCADTFHEDYNMETYYYVACRITAY